MHHSDLQSLRLVQDRRAAWWWILLMLIPFVNFIIRSFLLIDLAKSFGKGIGLWDWFAFAGGYFLPDPRLWQRAISRTRCWKFGRDRRRRLRSRLRQARSGGL